MPMTDLPPHLQPFVLDHEPVTPVHSGVLDLYLPASSAPAPAVLMVHGGPVRPDRPVRPPQWPTYQGYGALLAQAGLVGGMFEHGFTDDDSLDRALDDIRQAASALASEPRVDGERLGMWFFSVGGLFMGSALADPPAWHLAAVAGTYAAVRPPEELLTDLPDAVSHAELSDIPMLLVRPEEEFDWIQYGTDELLERTRAAGRLVDVIDVPGVQHGFETVDDNDEARRAIRDSVDWWARTLR
jgi:hypothetical protein